MYVCVRERESVCVCVCVFEFAIHLNALGLLSFHSTVREMKAGYY